MGAAIGATNSIDSCDSIKNLKSSDLAGDLPPGVELLSAAQYSLSEVLGSGSFGTVHLAIANEQKYAVKITTAESSQGDLKREMHLLQGMKHPCICHFHGVFFKDCRACFVLQYCPGGELLAASDRHHENKGPMTMPTIQNIVKMAVLAIDWLQIHSVVHRDVKAANIVLSIEEVDHPQCRAYLCDFGTAVRLGHGERLHDTVGSPSYWAPEVFQRDYGLQVDAWALGVLCSWLIWQQLPKAVGDKRKSFWDLQQSASRPRPSEEALEWLGYMLNEDEEERLTPEESLSAAFLGSIACAVESQETVPNSTVHGICSGERFMEGRLSHMASEGRGERAPRRRTRVDSGVTSMFSAISAMPSAVTAMGTYGHCHSTYSAISAMPSAVTAMGTHGHCHLEEAGAADLLVSESAGNTRADS